METSAPDSRLANSVGSIINSKVSVCNCEGFNESSI